MWLGISCSPMDDTTDEGQVKNRLTLSHLFLEKKKLSRDLRLAPSRLGLDLGVLFLNRLWFWSVLDLSYALLQLCYL